MQSVRSQAQRQLFSDPAISTVYEQPLNERMRSFLRLEYLFQAVAESMQRETVWDARNAVSGLIDITDQLNRADIKGDLIKEIERHLATLTGLRGNPGVNSQTLESMLTRLEPLLALLKSNACQPGARLRQNELITQVRQRLAIPGGLCSFDLPAFHHWLSSAYRRRLGQLNEWMDDLRIIEDAVHTTLKMMRESAVPQRAVAEGGFYQQSLDPTAACQLVRVSVADADEVFAEISGGKHRFTVRFMRQSEFATRPQQTTGNIEFDLQCCGL